MAVDKNSKRNTYSPHKGLPTNDGNPKAETKETDSKETDFENREEIRGKYTKSVDEPVDDLLENPNRNRNKPDIHKGKYN